MEICYHTIDENEVIGIGPLMVKRPSDVNERLMFNRLQLSFELHLRGHTTVIQSDWLDVGRADTGTSEQDKTNRELYDQFRNMHISATVTIRELIASRLNFHT